jgi:molybdopterin-containing oxidoreductase family membrane subunit
MGPERYLMGLFKDENQVVSAVNQLKASSYTFHRVNSPFPSHKIMDALNLKKSMVGWFTLAGGIFGLVGGFALAVFTAVQWNLIVGGKPIVAIVPFVIVGFEATILCAVFGNILGLMTQMRLPSYKLMQYYDPRCSGEYFGVLASCESNRENELNEFFRKQGAEVRVFE